MVDNHKFLVAKCGACLGTYFSDLSDPFPFCLLCISQPDRWTSGPLFTAFLKRLKGVALISDPVTGRVTKMVKLGLECGPRTYIGPMKPSAIVGWGQNGFKNMILPPLSAGKLDPIEDPFDLARRASECRDRFDRIFLSGLVFSVLLGGDAIGLSVHAERLARLFKGYWVIGDKNCNQAELMRGAEVYVDEHYDALVLILATGMCAIKDRVVHPVRDDTPYAYDMLHVFSRGADFSHMLGSDGTIHCSLDYLEMNLFMRDDRQMNWTSFEGSSEWWSQSVEEQIFPDKPVEVPTPSAPPVTVVQTEPTHHLTIHDVDVKVDTYVPHHTYVPEKIIPVTSQLEESALTDVHEVPSGYVVARCFKSSSQIRNQLTDSICEDLPRLFTHGDPVIDTHGVARGDEWIITVRAGTPFGTKIRLKALQTVFDNNLDPDEEDQPVIAQMKSYQDAFNLGTVPEVDPDEQRRHDDVFKRIRNAMTGKDVYDDTLVEQLLQCKVQVPTILDVKRNWPACAVWYVGPLDLVSYRVEVFNEPRNARWLKKDPFSNKGPIGHDRLFGREVRLMPYVNPLEWPVISGLPLGIRWRIDKRPKSCRINVRRPRKGRHKSPDIVEAVDAVRKL